MTNRGKGPGGMTIKQAIRQVITRLRRATGNDIHKEVKAIYGWGNHAILRHIMGQTINLQPGYYEWVYVKPEEKCLFLCEDGYFECYDQNKHGLFKDGIKIR